MNVSPNGPPFSQTSFVAFFVLLNHDNHSVCVFWKHSQNPHLSFLHCKWWWLLLWFCQEMLQMTTVSWPQSGDVFLILADSAPLLIWEFAIPLANYSGGSPSRNEEWQDRTMSGLIAWVLQEHFEKTSGSSPRKGIEFTPELVMFLLCEHRLMQTIH